MSSSRFPGKVLMRFPWGSGLTLIERIANQIKKSASLKEVVIATSIHPSDDPIESLCRREGFRLFRGDLENVHRRFVEANRSSAYGHIVRLTGDNPLLDIGFLDRLINHHLKTGNDYTFSSNLPLGCNFEIYRANALENFNPGEMTESEREHVTLHFKSHPDRYQVEKHEFETTEILELLANLRLTVDYPSDYALWNLMTTMNPNVASLEEVAELVRAFPWLREINKGNKQLVFN
jgi:spore coat polysaccharide biosynthesis protein SpsF